MSLKQLSYIRTKSELNSLYLSQYSAENIRLFINRIIDITRKDIPAGMRLFAKNISTQEVIIFIKRHGTPDGYILSEELKTKLTDYREYLENQKTKKKQSNDTQFKNIVPIRPASL